MFSTKSEVFTLPIRQNSVNSVKTNKNEIEQHSHNLSSSDITDDWIRIFGSYSGTQTSQTALPAFGETFQNTSSNCTKNQEMPASHGRVGNCSGHVDNRVGHVDRTSATLATILPGVIRHTSQPERLLAYYYTDRS